MLRGWQNATSLGTVWDRGGGILGRHAKKRAFEGELPNKNQRKGGWDGRSCEILR